MAFFDSLSTSWQIFKTSLRVLNSRKELVVFPILSGLTLTLIAVAMGAAAVFLLPVPEGEDLPPVYYPVLAIGYLILVYIGVFWQAALVSQANIALEGGDPSVAGGISIAAQRGGRLLPWAFITGAVSWIISVIEERVPFVGRFLDFAWRVISFQVLPTIVIEDLGPVAAAKRTKEILQRSWGKNAISVVGMQIFVFLMMLPAVASVFIAAFSGVEAVLVAGLVVAFVWFLITIVVGAALTGIYQTALYRFVADGQVPPAFAGVDLRQAIRTR